jgi:hypothetical protein
MIQPVSKFKGEVMKIKSFILGTLLIFFAGTNCFAQSPNAQLFSDVIITSPDGSWVDDRAFATLADAITAAGVDTRTVKVFTNQAVAANLIIPDNLNLEFEREGAITAGAGTTITVNTRNIKAPDRIVLTGTGDYDFANGTVLRSRWFTDLNKAIADTTDDEVTLILSYQGTITADRVVGNNVTLKWEGPGNQIAVNAGVTLSNINRIEAGPYLLFTGAGEFDYVDGITLRDTWFRYLRSAAAYIDADEVTLLIDRSDVMTTDITFTNTTLEILPGNDITTTGHTLYLYSPENIIASSRDQVFLGTGAIEFTRSGKCYVTWWNVVGDGITDDTAAIQRCLDSIRANGHIIFPAGPAYLVSGPLYFYNNTVIEGQNRESTEFNAVGLSAGEYVFSPVDNATQNTYRAMLKNFTITGDSTAGVNGIGLIRAHRCTLENIRINDIGGKSYVLDGTDNGVVSEGNYNVLIACHSVGTHTHGFDIIGNATGASNRNTLTACRDNGASTYSFHTDTQADTTQFFGCHAEASTYGFYIDSSSHHLSGCITESIVTTSLYLTANGDNVYAAGRFNTGTTPIVKLGANCTVLSVGEVGRAYNEINAHGVARVWASFDGSPVTALQTIGGATQANPVVITIVGHSVSEDEIIFIDDETGMTQINERAFCAKNVAVNTFELYEIDCVTTVNGIAYGAANNDGKVAEQVPAVYDSFGVDYIFGYGAGRYVVWFTDAFNTTNYVALVTCDTGTFAAFAGTGSYEEEFVKFYTRIHDNTLTDVNIGNIVIFGGRN